MLKNIQIDNQEKMLLWHDRDLVETLQEIIPISDDPEWEESLIEWSIIWAKQRVDMVTQLPINYFYKKRVCKK